MGAVSRRKPTTLEPRYLPSEVGEIRDDEFGVLERPHHRVPATGKPYVVLIGQEDHIACREADGSLERSNVPAVRLSADEANAGIDNPGDY